MKKTAFSIALVLSSLVSLFGINKYNVDYFNNDLETHATYPTSPSTACWTNGTDLAYETGPLLFNNTKYWNETNQRYETYYPYKYISTSSTAQELLNLASATLPELMLSNHVNNHEDYDDVPDTVNSSYFNLTLFSTTKNWDSDGVEDPNNWADETNDIIGTDLSNQIWTFTDPDKTEIYHGVVQYNTDDFYILVEVTPEGEANGFCNYSYSNLPGSTSVIQFYTPYDLSTQSISLNSFINSNLSTIDEGTSLNEITIEIEYLINEYFDYLNYTSAEAWTDYPDNNGVFNDETNDKLATNFAPSSMYDLEITYSIDTNTIIEEPFYVYVTNNNDVAYGTATIYIEPEIVNAPTPPATPDVSKSYPILITTSVLVGLSAITSMSIILYIRHKYKEKDSNTQQDE